MVQCTTSSSSDGGSAGGVFSKMNDLRATFTALILSFSKPQTGYLCKRLVNHEKSQCFSNNHRPRVTPTVVLILYSGKHLLQHQPLWIPSFESSYFHPGQVLWKKDQIGNKPNYYHCPVSTIPRYTNSNVYLQHDAVSTGMMAVIEAVCGEFEKFILS